MQIDAWQAYDQFGKYYGSNAGTLKSRCWAHPRRGFIDAGSDAPLAQQALLRIAELCAIEMDIRGCSAEERLAARQTCSRSLVDKLHAWFTPIALRIVAGTATMRSAMK